MHAVSNQKGHVFLSVSAQIYRPGLSDLLVAVRPRSMTSQAPDGELAGWNIIVSVSEYLDVVSITRFDNTHRNASLMKGVRRTFVHYSPSFVPFAGQGRRLDASPERVHFAGKNRRLSATLQKVSSAGVGRRLEEVPEGEENKQQV